MATKTHIRSMQPAEVTQLVAWAQSEGWNPGVHDAATLRAIDPEAFLAIESDDSDAGDANGNMAGGILGGGAVFKHSDTFGFMGLFIMRPEYRGRGLGRQLWYARRDHLLSRLDAGANAVIGMDGVSAMVPFYAKGGFEAVTRHCRYAATNIDVRAKLAATATGNDSHVGEIVELNLVPRQDIADLDRQCFPGPRDRYLEAWLNQPEIQSVAIVSDSKLAGYGVMRPCIQGFKVGPLFAADAKAAAALFGRFLHLAGNQPVYLDVPENNPAAVQLCKDFGMEEVFSCTRMYYGKAPQLADAMIFGATSLEAG